MQRPLNIPLDLCFDIIDAVSAGRHLDHLRRKTLQACARTCSAWLGGARFQLYHDVRWHLLDRPDIKTLGKFSDTIAAVPELGALVTHIDISIWGLQYFPDVWTDEASAWGDEARGPFSLCAVQHLLNLRSIKLFGTRDAPTTAIVESLIQRLSRAPSVRKLTLQFVLFDSLKALISLLEHFPHLTSLEVSYVTWADGAEHPANELNSSESMSRDLTQLTLTDNSLHFPLLHVFPSTIKVLELGRLYHDKSTPELLGDQYEALSSYINLEILKLDATIGHGIEVGWLSNAVLHARSLGLGELFLRFRFAGVPLQTAIDLARCKNMDDVLSRGPFLSLQRIVVKIYSCIGPPEADDVEGFVADSRGTLEQRIAASFNQSARRGIKVIPDVTLLARDTLPGHLLDDPIRAVGQTR